MFNDFFERLNTSEKITSIFTGFVTWFGGLILLDSSIWAYTIKGVMWLIGVSFGALIPKIMSTYYETYLKDKIFKSKIKKDDNKDPNEKAA